MAEFVHETGGEGLSVMFLEKKVNLKLGLQDISATQILREITFWDSRSSKSAIYWRFRDQNYLYSQNIT